MDIDIKTPAGPNGTWTEEQIAARTAAVNKPNPYAHLTQDEDAAELKFARVFG